MSDARMAAAASVYVQDEEAPDDSGGGGGRVLLGSSSSAHDILALKLRSLKVHKQRPFSAAGAALSVRSGLHDGRFNGGGGAAAALQSPPARPKSSQSMRNVHGLSKSSHTSRLAPLQHALQADVTALARTVFVPAAPGPAPSSPPTRRGSSIPPRARRPASSSASHRTGHTTHRSVSAARVRSRPTTAAGAFVSLLGQHAPPAFDELCAVPEVVLLDARTGLPRSHLDLTAWAPVLDDPAFAAIVAYAGAAWTSLSLADCCRLSGAATALSLANCARLISLDASTTSALCEMLDFQALSALQVLSLASTRADDRCLQLLAKECRVLRALDLSCCQCIRSVGLDVLLASNRHIEVINLAFTNSVPPEALTVCARLPRSCCGGRRARCTHTHTHTQLARWCAETL
jgi:hypothetical protein